MSILFQGSTGADAIVGSSTAADTILNAQAHSFIDLAGDTQAGSTSGDVLFGGGGSDTLTGGAGADWISSGLNFGGSHTTAADVDFQFGGAGADTFWGGLGHDNIFGGTGNDVFVTHGGAEVVFGGQGDDAINVAHQASTTFMYSGDIGNDVIVSAGGAGTVLGGDGNDVITDLSVSGAGAARADANLATALTVDGAHQLFGNAGADTISSASQGDVSLFGGQDDDVVSVSGAAGLHMLFGNLGDDTLSVTGGAAASIFGGQGDDHITGDASASASVHSFLSGDLGNDVIIAGAGGDTLAGGAGADTLTGGAGADTFAIHAGDSTAAAGATGKANLDVITAGSFGHGSDHVLIAGHNDAIFTSDGVHAVNVAQGSAADYASAYAFAYGGAETSGAVDASHFTAGIEYVAVITPASGGAAAATFLFANDAAHTALEFQGTAAGSITLSAGDVLHG